ncbi:hypothetical protein OSTOST_19597 [Ostertagia ostertagi]
MRTRLPLLLLSFPLLSHAFLSQSLGIRGTLAMWHETARKSYRTILHFPTNYWRQTRPIRLGCSISPEQQHVYYPCHRFWKSKAIVKGGNEKSNYQARKRTSREQRRW